MVHAHAHKLTSRLFELLPPRRGKNEMGVRIENQDHPFLHPYIGTVADTDVGDHVYVTPILRACRHEDHLHPIPF